MAHTPGPWRKANYGWAIVAGEDDSYYGGHWVAEVSEPKNIPVITAAPDLLAACEAALADHMKRGMVELDTMAKIKWVIEKAKGE